MLIFFIILGLLSFAGLSFIIYRKLYTLTLIDAEKNIPKAKKVKEAVIASRFQRILEKNRKKFKNLFSLMRENFKKFFEQLTDKLMEAEKSVGALNKKVKEKTKTKELDVKINQLLLEAKELEKTDLKQAEGKYIEVIKIDAKNTEAYKGLAKIYVENKQTNEARQILNFLIKLGVEEADIFINLANLAWEENNLDEAKIYYLKALSLDGTKVGARINLGLVFNELGDKESAAQQFKAALELEARNPRYLDLLIESGLKIGDKELAKEALKNLELTNPENQKIKEFKKRIKELK